MQDFIKKYWKTLLFFAVVGIVGGFFVGLYLLDSYPDEIRQQLVAELNGFDLIPIDILVGIVTAVQSAGYGLILGGLGFLFGYLYQKYGLRYAMIAHGGCHIVSKLIWVLFI